MALVDLGTQAVAIEDEWVSFAPIELRNRRIYNVETLISSVNPDLVYSKFIFRFQYPTENTAIAKSQTVTTLFYDPQTQFFPIFIDNNLGNNQNCIIEVRRFPIFSSPSLLADVTVNVQLDPDVNYQP